MATGDSLLWQGWDLFVGRWIYMDGMKKNVPTPHSLFFCFRKIAEPCIAHILRNLRRLERRRERHMRARHGLSSLQQRLTRLSRAVLGPVGLVLHLLTRAALLGSEKGSMLDLD